MHGLEVEGEVDVHPATLGLGRPHGEALVLAIEPLQPGEGVGHTDAAAFGSILVRARQSPAVVPDHQVQVPALPARLDRDKPRATPRLDSVANGVLDQRLENERRNQRIPEFVGNVLHLEPVAKALLLDADVAPDELEFLRQRGISSSIEYSVRRSNSLRSPSISSAARGLT